MYIIQLKLKLSYLLWALSLNDRTVTFLLVHWSLLCLTHRSHVSYSPLILCGHQTQNSTGSSLLKFEVLEVTGTHGMTLPSTSFQGRRIIGNALHVQSIFIYDDTFAKRGLMKVNLRYMENFPLSAVINCKKSFR